jgi:hypothetical protein
MKIKKVHTKESAERIKSQRFIKSKMNKRRAVRGIERQRDRESQSEEASGGWGGGGRRWQSSQAVEGTLSLPARFND